MSHATNAEAATFAPVRYQAGSVLVTLTQTGSGTYTVTCEQGTLRLDAEGWCRAYATEGEARDAARHAARVFRQYATVWAWRARREQLRDTVEEQLRRQSRRMHNARQLRDAQAEYDTLATLTDLANLDALKARFAHTAA